MPTVTFADIVHPTLSFSSDTTIGNILLRLIDTPWMQRLRDINQTGSTRLVYMFSEHSRFGHSLEVAYLATSVLEKLRKKAPVTEFKEYSDAICIAALLHDIGHLAPGSHTAFKVWFPKSHDAHEEVGISIINTDPLFKKILGKELSQKVIKILSESPDIPAWTWEIVSGGGWNIDRGNWCIADSIMAGVSYGKYNIPALTESITISPNGTIVLLENRLDAMVHFAVSRHAMYQQVYLHRVMLSADALTGAIILRARDLFNEKNVSVPFFYDETMRMVLLASSVEAVSLETIFRMRESWWLYHLMRWTESKDLILRDLSQRALNRNLFKTVRINSKNDRQTIFTNAQKELKKQKFDSRYYLHELSSHSIKKHDGAQMISVMTDQGDIVALKDADPIFRALSSTTKKSWWAMPGEVKQVL